MKLSHNTRNLLLLGGAAALAFVPSLRTKVAAWWVGPAASKLAYGSPIGTDNQGLEIALQTPSDPAASKLEAPQVSDHVGFWSGLADATIAPIQEWVTSTAGQAVAALQSASAPSGGGVLPNASVGIGYGTGQAQAPAPSTKDPMDTSRLPIFRADPILTGTYE